MQSFIDSFASGQGAVGNLLLMALSLAVIIFVVMIASFVYHWNYYGIAKGLRFGLLITFTLVGLVLLLVAGILMLRFVSF